MTIQTITFDPTRLDDEKVTTRLFNRLGDEEVTDLEYHPNVTRGPSITGYIVATDYAHLGLWNEAGIALGDHPNLVMEADVIEPDVRECWINLYRSSENTHGFTVGSKTGAEADMRARGLRNANGGYIATVKVSVDLNNATRV